MQDGATFAGVLEDFTALSFRVLVSARSHQTFEWIDEEAPLYVVLSGGKEMLYSGECRIVRQTETRRQRIFVLEPLRKETGKLSRDRLNSAGLVLCASTRFVAFQPPVDGEEDESRS